jgi:hypothetical protein
MRHSFVGLIMVGCIGAICAPVGCSGSSEPPGAASQSAPESAPVGVAEEAQKAQAGTCTHDTCTIGAPLGQACSACTETVCSPYFGGEYCCGLTWDARCVTLANAFCGTQGTQSCSCTHSLCDTGIALDSGCNDCTALTCASMPQCCSTAWTEDCIQFANMFCGTSCAPACKHSPCVTGAALQSTCDPCVQTVCAGGPFGDKKCCTQAWTSECIDLVATCEGGCDNF